MDDRIRGEFDRNHGKNQTPPSDQRKRNSRAGDFKISIDYDDMSSQNNMNGRTSSSSGSGYPGKFQVSIPDNESQRPSASSYYSQRPSYAGRTQNTQPQRSSQGVRSAPTARPSRPAKPVQPTRPASAPRTTQTTPAQRPTRPAGASQSASSASRPTAQRRPAAGQSSISQQGNRPAQRSAAQSTVRKTASSGGTGQKRPASKRRPAKKKTKANAKKTFMTVIVCVLIIAFITTTASSIALTTINDILAINKESTEAVSVVIPEGAAFDEVFKAIADAGLIKQRLICKLFCKFRKYDNYTVTDKETGAKKKVAVEYVAGVYYFDTDEGIETMLESVKASRTVSKDTVRITFPEGWTIAQIFAKIEKYNICTADRLYANLEIVGKQYGFYEAIPANSGRYLKAEGYLFPDTYDFYIGENANSVLKKLFSNFEAKWKKEYDRKLKETGMTKDQIIIMASILQREAKDKTQMADIASVLYNRLKQGSGYPQLQLNSTKDYVTSVNELGVFSDFYYSLYLDSYNTYSNNGLPPGAICNPGVDAIEAALNPKSTNYYFFCHDSNGEIYLASTAAEHEINTRKIFNESN